MKKILKKITAVFLTALIFALPLSCVSYAFSYPEGVSESEALNAVTATDRLIGAACKTYYNKPLKSIVTPLIYSDDTLSALLTGVYASLEESASELKTIGVDTSVKSVAEGLSDYPEVSAALLGYSSWSEVSLDGVKWGVTEKKGFSRAVAASLSPLNDVLYALLCSGSFKISLITIKGANGYENAVVPILRSLGCEELLTQGEFTNEAKNDKNAMLYNIVLSVMTALEKMCDTPSTSLCTVLPQFAYFVESGSFNECMDSLFSPITSNRLVEAAVFLKLFDLDSFNIDLEGMINEMLSSVASENGLTLPAIDFSKLSECGSVSGTDFTPDKGKAYVVITNYLEKLLKNNSEKLPELLKGDGSNTFETPEELLGGLSSLGDGELTAFVISLFSPQKAGDAKSLVFPTFTKAEVSYTPNLTVENYEKVLNNIDALIDEFVEEGGEYSTIDEMLSYSVYTSDNMSELTVSIYKELENAGLTELLSLLGIDITPKGVASSLKENGYSSVRSKLLKYDSWQKLSLKGTSWGFRNGSSTGFENALTATLRPLFPILRMLLAGEDLVILDSITLKGTDGYNTAVIPLLEALGCKSADIKTYKQYLKNADTDGVIKAVLDPVFNLIDEVFEKPVYTLTELLPNFVYFIEGDNLEICLENLLLPLTGILDMLPGSLNLDFDTDSVLDELDVNKLISSLTKDSGINMPQLDFSSLAYLGDSELRSSKSIVNSNPVRITYVKADRTAVLITVLRAFVDILKTPGNESLLTSVTDSNSAMSQYSSSIGEQLASMNTDETVEWLYNLLFKDRVKKELKTDEVYSPTIIYEESEGSNTLIKVLIGIGGVLILAGAIVFINRKRIFSPDGVSVR